MRKTKIVETNHTLKEIFKRKDVNPDIENLLWEYLDKLDARIQTPGKMVFFETQKDGITVKYENSRTAFIFIDLRKTFISTKFWTGDRSIPGLKKDFWLYNTENYGSERIRLEYSTDVDRAVDFASHSLKIKINK